MIPLRSFPSLVDTLNGPDYDGFCGSSQRLCHATTHTHHCADSGGSLFQAKVYGEAGDPSTIAERRIKEDGRWVAMKSCSPCTRVMLRSAATVALILPRLRSVSDRAGWR